MSIHFPMNFKAKLRNFRFHLHCNNELQAISITNILLLLIFVIVWFDHSMYDDGDENLSLTHSLRFGSFVQKEKKKDSQKSTSVDLVQMIR